MKVSANAGVAFVDWLAANCSQGDQVGVDGQVLALTVVRMLQDALATCGASLRLDLDLLEQVWPQRPGLPRAPVFEQQQRYAPVPRSAELSHVRDSMQKARAGWHLISTLDDVAWLLNLRGSDVPYNPVFVAHLLVGPDSATLFVMDGKVPPELRARLASDRVTLAAYHDLGAHLAQVPTA